MTNRNSNPQFFQMLWQDLDIFMAENPATKELWRNLMRRKDIPLSDGVTGFLADAVMVALCTADMIEDADLNSRFNVGSAVVSILKRLYPEEILSVEEITAVAKRAVDPVGTGDLELIWSSDRSYLHDEVVDPREDLVHAL